MAYNYTTLNSIPRQYKLITYTWNAAMNPINVSAILVLCVRMYREENYKLMQVTRSNPIFVPAPLTKSVPIQMDPPCPDRSCPLSGMCHLQDTPPCVANSNRGANTNTQHHIHTIQYFWVGCPDRIYAIGYQLSTWWRHYGGYKSSWSSGIWNEEDWNKAYYEWWERFCTKSKAPPR